MSDSAESNPPPKGQFLVYQAEDGRVKIDVRAAGWGVVEGTASA
ncbi:MAG TPA: hypothetical protein VIS71_06040 [Terrimicrobium sp.]